jgi:phosphatidylglycerol:prolipoprotein diacylglycerol transferase
MYPTLYHFFYDIFGDAPRFLKIIPMFGFWVGIAFIIASWIGGKEIERRQKLGLLKIQKKTITIGKPASITDYISNGVMGFFLGFKLVYIFFHSEVTENFPGFIMSGKGHLIGGIIVAVLLVTWKYFESKKESLTEPYQKEIDFYPHQHMSNITMLSVVGGILGAVFFAFLEQPGELISRFSRTGDISDLYGGLTIYGGIIVASLANLYYFWKNKLNTFQFLDALGPTVLLAYGIGRLGCQMSGDGDWGIENLNPKPDWMAFLPDWMWAYDYPNNVNGEGVLMENCIFQEVNSLGEINNQYCYKLPTTVYPTPLYETIMSFGLFGVLWSLRKKITIPMILFSLYIFFTGVERLLIERIRVNVEYGSGFTQAELISIGLILLGAVGIVFFYLRGKKKEESI